MLCMATSTTVPNNQHGSAMQHATASTAVPCSMQQQVRQCHAACNSKYGSAMQHATASTTVPCSMQQQVRQCHAVCNSKHDSAMQQVLHLSCMRCTRRLPRVFIPMHAALQRCRLLRCTNGPPTLYCAVLGFYIIVVAVCPAVNLFG